MAHPAYGSVVIVILDGRYAFDLQQLARRGPVWIIETPETRPVVEAFWANRSPTSSLQVTIFSTGGVTEPSQILLNELATIDLHQGEVSVGTNYDAMEVFGSSPSDAIKTALADYGFKSFDITTDGFRVTRSTNAQAVSPVTHGLNIQP